VGRPVAAWLLVGVAPIVLAAAPARAQQGAIEGLTAILDLNASAITTTITQPSGAVTTQTGSLYPRLTLNMDTLLSSSFRLNAGGVFEVNQSSLGFNGGDTNTTISRLTPFFQVRSIDPWFAPGFAYFRRENRTRTQGLPGLTVVNEDYAAYLAWKPEGLPRSDFQFVRTNTFDKARSLLDSTKHFGSLVSRYEYKGLGASYQGTYLATDDRIARLETHQVSNGLRVDQSASLVRKRLLWNATYNVTRQDFTTMARGEGGEVAFPVPPFAGLAALSDTPATATLAQNALLVDGNLTASAGIDLGLPALGADAQARNFGLDFLNPARVDRLLVWVDRELPPEIAQSFTWEIYSSADNLVWRRETTVTAAPFGPFELRFQIDFPAVTARYLKVVTRPLSPVLPDASRFPQIFVTELQAFERRPAEEARGRLGRTTHALTTDVRMRLLETPSLFYESSYLYYRLGAAESTRDTWSNGMSVAHAFGRFVSVYGRGAREQGVQPEGRRVATVTNGTISVDPIHTFRTSLLYTGQDERIGETRLDRKGFFVQNTAQVYRGVDLIFGIGWNLTTRETGEAVHDRLANVSGTIVPRQNLSVTFNYASTTSRRSGPFTGAPRFRTGRTYVTVAYDPVRTLRLVAGEEVIVGLGERTRRTHDLGANWAPFPDGTLQFLFAYDENLRSLEFGTERILRAGVRWFLTRRSYVDVTHQRIRSEFVFQRTDVRVLSVDVKLFF
jgi:hypothetical protein